MKVYTVVYKYLKTDYNIHTIVDVFSSLAEAEECVLLNSYYDTLYEFNYYNCWDVETFNYKDWLNTMLAASDEYLIQEWEI